MKIERNKPAAAPVRPGHAPAPDTGGATAAGAARAINDVTTIMGIPDAELTPKVRAAIMALLGEVDQLRRDLRDAQARLGHLEKLADQDPLAPIANRRAFIRELSRVISYAQRYSIPASVLFFDLNGLKAINDSRGHVAGDAVLTHVANILVENVRGSDFVGRLGGDEFGVILANADQSAANEKAQSLAAAIETSEFRWDGERIPISLAFGAYSFKAGEDPTSAIDNADKAMYRNKQQGRGAS